MAKLQETSRRSIRSERLISRRSPPRQWRRARKPPCPSPACETLQQDHSRRLSRPSQAERARDDGRGVRRPGRAVDRLGRRGLALASILEDGTPIASPARTSSAAPSAMPRRASTSGRTRASRRSGAAAGRRARRSDPQQPARENAAIGFSRHGHNVQAPSRHLGSAWRLHQRRPDDDRRVRAVGETKWGREPSLVLPPARHEGRGPRQRFERFLQLAADINMRVANCTTAAQFFHQLRRQAAR
jgi:2-oxoglutarate dehydrogenase E1 component